MYAYAGIPDIAYAPTSFICESRLYRTCSFLLPISHFRLILRGKLSTQKVDVTFYQIKIDR